MIGWRAGAPVRRAQARAVNTGHAARGGAQGLPRVLRARCMPWIRTWMLMGN